MKLSTIIIATVTIALAAYIALEFAGVFGERQGNVSAGLIGMLILVSALLIGDLRRNRVEVDR